MSGAISENFTYEEFTDSAIAKKYGIKNEIPTIEVASNIKALVENVLQPLRGIVGYPLPLNSGYRSRMLNRIVGSEEASQHRVGEAADILCRLPISLAQAALSNHLPYDQCIIYPTFVHFSYKRNGANRHQILYSDAYTRWLKKKQETTQNRNHLL